MMRVRGCLQALLIPRALLLATAAIVCAGAFVSGAGVTEAAAAGHADAPLLLPVDHDDDDGNGVPDGEQALVPPGTDLGVLARPAKLIPGAQLRARGAEVRLLVDGEALAKGASVPLSAKRFELQAIAPGRAEVEIFGATIRVRAIEIRAVGADGAPVDLTRGRASIERTPPERLAADPFAPGADPDALRFVVIGAADDLPGTIDLLSFAPSGAGIDALNRVALAEVRCPDDVPTGLTCGSTVPIRAALDEIDRRHPLILDRSIRAELGGALAVASSRGGKFQMIRVGGPRRSSVGAIDRYRARLRVHLVRPRPHGPPPVGGDDAGAVAALRAEVERANALWGACGVSFGPPAELEAEVVDPPPPHLLALGCDHGLPASGGEIRLRAEGRAIKVPLTRGARPADAARAVAAAIEAAGLAATVSDNAPIAAGAFGSADVLVWRRGGGLATLDLPVSGPLSTDRTMTACLGRVSLEDGLQHFGDIDAIAGTVEERALIKAFDDGDPSTIEVFVIPSFAGGGRIGESFISADGGAIRNVVIEDRSGLRADRASFTLAHELGHVLLDEPGHPDDFGVDTPTRLMDADAANPSAYGPRRLLVEECARALRQSGPGAPTALLRPSPLSRLGAREPSPWTPGPELAQRPR
jgi:hypothetical protein